jgi:hypothetical protein
VLIALERLLSDVGLQDGLGWDDVVVFAAGATTVLTFLTLLARPVWGEFKEFLAWSKKFRQDWDGEPARDGRDAVPGVMARMNRIDGEFSRNGGSTMKDSQFRTERALHRMEVRQTVSERYNASAMRATEENLRRLRDSMHEEGRTPVAFVPFPDPPVIIGDEPEEVPHGSDPGNGG